MTRPPLAAALLAAATLATAPALGREIYVSNEKGNSITIIDGDSLERSGTKLRAWSFSLLSTVEVISGLTVSRFKERRMLVRIWVRASDTVQAAFLSLEAVVATLAAAFPCRWR